MGEGEAGDPRGFMTAHAGDRLALIAESFRRLVGQDLAGGGADLADALWAAPRAILAHGTEAEPVFFYGNRLTLRLFETTAEAFVATPSRLSAEPTHRAERARLLAEVARRGFIDDYSGVRISATGRRFRIEQAIVWNLVDAQGALHGQAASFARWTRLD
jgi:hypothetical protein